MCEWHSLYGINSVAYLEIGTIVSLLQLIVLNWKYCNSLLLHFFRSLSLPLTHHSHYIQQIILFIRSKYLLQLCKVHTMSNDIKMFGEENWKMNQIHQKFSLSFFFSNSTRLLRKFEFVYKWAKTTIITWKCNFSFGNFDSENACKVTFRIQQNNNKINWKMSGTICLHVQQNNNIR